MMGGNYSGSGGTIFYADNNPGIIGAMDVFLNNNNSLNHGIGSIDDLRFFHRELSPDEVCLLTEPEADCLINEPFIEDSEFSGINNNNDNGLTIENGKLNFNNVQDGLNTDRRIWKSLGLNTPETFIWSFEFTPEFNNLPVGHAIALTDSNLALINIYQNGTYLLTDQDAVILYPVSNISSPFNYQLAFLVKDGTVSYIYNSTDYYADKWTDPVLTVNLNNIRLITGLTYYIRVEKISEYNYILNVFTDPERTLHTSGSPACLRIHNSENINILGLNYFQASNLVQGSPLRRLTASLDNICIDPVLYEYIISGPKNLCPGDTAVFNLEGAGNKQVIWNYPSDANVLLENNQELKVAWGDSEGTVRVQIIRECDTLIISQLNVKTASNCQVELIIPNVFSPDGDGINELFSFQTKGILTLNGRIFNRWGQEIYSWDNLINYWDGTYKGTLVPEGVYFYVLESTNIFYNTKVYKGTVTLIR
jgi:gliding motility-associated-like protein